MDYTVKTLADLTGVSTRTLRYYDQIGLLKPARYTEAGYRIYSETEVDLLQQILFYRAIGLDLATIQKTMQQPDFDIQDALEKHREALQKKKEEINHLLQTVEQTIAHNKGEISMTNQEKFEAFKKAKLAEHEETFGEESRELYGKDAVDFAAKQWQGLTQEQYEEMQKTEKEMFATLKQVAERNDLDSSEARQVYEAHKKWLMASWKEYDAQKHMGVAQLYLMDERFMDYYKKQGGLSKEEVEWLVKIVTRYAQ